MEQSIQSRAQADARRILRSLLLGVDPDNHSRLSPECVVMQPDVKVALALGVEALQDTAWVRRWREKRATVSFPAQTARKHVGLPIRPPQKTQQVGQAGQSWSKQEDQRLISAFYQGRSCTEIALAHGRTPEAIAARFVKLGLAQNRREARRLAQS